MIRCAYRSGVRSWPMHNCPIYETTQDPFCSSSSSKSVSGIWLYCMFAYFRHRNKIYEIAKFLLSQGWDSRSSGSRYTTTTAAATSWTGAISTPGTTDQPATGAIKQCTPGMVAWRSYIAIVMLAAREFSDSTRAYEWHGSCSGCSGYRAQSCTRIRCDSSRWDEHHGPEPRGRGRGA